MSENPKLDLILSTLQALTDRIGKTEADAAAALESANITAKILKQKSPAINPDHGSGAGIGLDQALKLVSETEDKTTARLTRFLELAMSSQSKAQDSFMKGLALGQQLAAVDLDGDGEPDGASYIAPIVDLFRELRASKGNGAAKGAEFVKGIEHGLQSRILSGPGGEARGDRPADGEKN